MSADAAFRMMRRARQHVRLRYVDICGDARTRPGNPRETRPNGATGRLLASVPHSARVEEQEM
jgi:hypothetical protein